MSGQDAEQQNILVNITDRYRSEVEFSVVARGGMHELLGLYVDVLKMYPCVPGPTMIEAMLVRTWYRLTLVPNIRQYPLLPPTLDTRGAWVLRGEDVELFGIKFEWPALTAVDVVLRAEVYDHLEGDRLTASSQTYRLQRNGEHIPRESPGLTFGLDDFLGQRSPFVPDDNPIPVSDYLYKVMTIDGFLEEVGGPAAAQANQDAYSEIAALFNCDVGDLESLLSEKPKHKVIFGAKVHPLMAQRLIEVEPILRKHLVEGSESPKKTAILFLAADPSDQVRLRLGEEFREIESSLRVSELRSQFRLELPQLALRPKDISQRLLDVEPEIVHFSGHGTRRGALCFENELGEAKAIEPAALAQLFENFAEQVECVVLNACYSERQARAIALHIPYVVGMKRAVADQAAIAFAVGFYQGLGGGRSIEEAFELGRAQAGLAEGTVKNLAPVLIKRSEN